MDTSTAATIPPPLSVAVPETFTVLPFVMALPAVGVVIVATGGVASVDWVAAWSVSSNVPGWAPMSASTLTVACCMSTEGLGPTPSWWLSRPQDHRMVPAEKTRAPLAARYSVMLLVGVPWA